jgi:hypothetical protein
LSAGPFQVDSNTGLATGQALGIDFEVMGASWAQLKADLRPGQSHGRTEITLADDVMIQLEMFSEGSAITFKLNGNNFDDLEEGDKVVIDEDRNVTVNGTAREPQAGPS